MTDKKTKKSIKKISRDSVKSLKNKIASLDNELLKQSEETQRIIDKNIRLLAEFDNYKRRTNEERCKLLKYDGESLAISLLPILDDLHRTLESDSKMKVGTIIEGLELIMANLIKYLKNKDIMTFDSIGQDLILSDMKH